MALHVPKAPGFSSMMKDGSRFFSGLEEAVFRNIGACREFSQTVATAFGPNGMNKMVINHLDKLFVTNDAATIVNELDVEHPAAKMMVLGAQMMEQEVGDGTNFVIVLAGALLKEAESLLRMGLKPTEVASGYELALEKALSLLETLVCKEIKDVRNEDEILPVLKTSIMSKQLGHEEFLSKLVAKVCLSILPNKAESFNVDNVRVTKISGSGLLGSLVIPGMVFRRGVLSDITKCTDAKVAIFTCPVDASQTETKGTVLIKTAAELSSFSRGEECLLEAQIKAIADSGAKVVVSGGKIGDLAIHYLNKYKLMAVRLNSKWDVRRLCKAVNATPLPKMTAPTKEELGFCDKVYIDELGETAIVVFRMGESAKQTAIATIVVRGATDNCMDDIERAIDDGVNTFKGLTKDARVVPGGGAVEMELSRQVATFGGTCEGLEQYAVEKFAEALQVVPRLLAENSGCKASAVISKLLAAHQSGQVNAGFNVDADGVENVVIDSMEKSILDLMILKHWGLKYATEAACTVLRVDQIIMAKRAGGPKPRPGGPPMDQDEDY